MSKKDAERERASDAAIVDPPKLPRHLKHHARKPSRVDVDVSQFLLGSTVKESEHFCRLYMRIRQ